MFQDPRIAVNPVIWLLTSLATVFLGLRLWCRHFRHRGLWWDDYIFVASWVLLVSVSAVVSAGLDAGFGLLEHETQQTQILFRTGVSLNAICTALTKTAFGATLLRLAEGWQRRMIWFIIVSVNLLNITNAIIWWVWPCGTPELPDVSLPGQCVSYLVEAMLSTACAAYGAIVDFLMAMVPWAYIWKLKSHRGERWSISLAMSLGVVAGFTNVARIVFTVETNPGQHDMSTSAGRTESAYENAVLADWFQTEPAVTIIAATIPILRTLVRDVLSRRNGISDNAMGPMPKRLLGTTQGGSEITEPKSPAKSSGQFQGN